MTTSTPSSTSGTVGTDADNALKAKHRTMWALGDYHAVATEIIPDLGPVLVQAAHLGPEDHVLDVAAGSGNVAIPAAATDAPARAAELARALLDRAERFHTPDGGFAWEYLLVVATRA